LEKSKVIVVDASVIVKWFLDEPYSSKALRIRDDYVRRIVRIAVPSILEYEVLNALKYSGVYSIDELEEIGVSLNKYGFDTYNLKGELKIKAIKIAVENNITIYDASYIALTQKLKTKLYTADKELIEKFPDNVIHIKYYS